MTHPSLEWRSQKGCAPLVRAPRQARVVSRFEIVETKGAVYATQPYRPLVEEPAPVVVPPRVVSPRPCECCGTLFMPRTARIVDCAVCVARIPWSLRAKPKVKVWRPAPVVQDRMYWARVRQQQNIERLARLEELRRGLVHLNAPETA